MSYHAEFGEAFGAHADQPDFHQHILGRTDAASRTKSVRSAAQTGGAIDHCGVCLWEAHRNRVSLAVSIGGHGRLLPRR
jgi:hypothetical protein